VPFILRIDIRNLLPFVVVRGEPVLEPTVNPVKVIAPAEAPFVTKMSTAQSEEGFVIVYAPLFVTYW